jgi:hypothetical protein
MNVIPLETPSLRNFEFRTITDTDMFAVKIPLGENDT